MSSSPLSTEPAPQRHGLTGYGHPAYAQSLAEFGNPFELPASGGWLLERAVPATSECDAMGCYPIFSAVKWQALGEDLAALSPRLVSVALVADPFGEYAPEQLSLWFDRVVAFKEHYIADSSKPLHISKHHAYYARKAAAAVKIEIGVPPSSFFAEWTTLYGSLVHRRRLRGIKAFSRNSFEVQLGVPGMVVIRAFENGSLVGAHLWYEQQGVAYSHLAAASHRGYEVSCSYAIYSAAIEYFRSRVQYIDFGAGAGTTACDDGLSRFKEGWSNDRRTAYFCGRVLNLEHYESLAKASQGHDSDYFPIYRSGELT